MLQANLPSWYLPSLNCATVIAWSRAVNYRHRQYSHQYRVESNILYLFYCNSIIEIFDKDEWGPFLGTCSCHWYWHQHETITWPPCNLYSELASMILSVALVNDMNKTQDVSKGTSHWCSDDQRCPSMTKTNPSTKTTVASLQSLLQQPPWLPRPHIVQSDELDWTLISQEKLISRNQKR